MNFVMAWLVSYGLETAGAALGTIIVGWVLAKIPTGKWAKSLAESGEKAGKAVTDYCRKKIPLWNKVIEPVFIDTLAVIPAYLAGFIRGLKYDNPNE